MQSSNPSVVILAGPNGAGKTTISREVLDRTLGIKHFVNADTIAAGLSAFDPDAAAFAAGRLMLARIRELAAARESFAFETTLASRTFAPFLKQQRLRGYRIHLVYIWLSSPDRAIKRVQRRVRSGGHDVPVDTIRRRYTRSISNLFDLYLPLVDTWLVLDNSSSAGATPVASRAFDSQPVIHDSAEWSKILAQAKH